MRTTPQRDDRDSAATDSVPGAEGWPDDGSAAALADRRLFAGRLLLVATALAALGVAAFAIDLPVASWCKSHRLPGELGRLVTLCEAFGHSLSVALILLAALLLDDGLAAPRPRRFGSREQAFVQLVAMAYAGGLVVDLIKASVTRVRPRAADLATLASTFGTFGDGSLAAGGGHRADLMSFPSGHSAVAAGLAAALCWRYPRGWPLFAAVAAGTAAQRVCSSAHYPSDTAFGAAVGLAAAAICLGVVGRTDRLAHDRRP